VTISPRQLNNAAHWSPTPYLLIIIPEATSCAGVAFCFNPRSLPGQPHFNQIKLHQIINSANGFLGCIPVFKPGFVV
jgi:hypothetical protein